MAGNELLITGAGGNTRRSAAEALIEHGFEVRALVHAADDRSATSIYIGVPSPLNAQVSARNGRLRQ